MGAFGERRRWSARAAAACAAALLLAAGCSSAPRGPQPSFALRNEAADLAKRGDAALAKGDAGLALELYSQSLRLNASVDNLEGVAAARISTGRLYLGIGETAAAGREFSEGAEAARLASAPVLEANALAGSGEVLYRGGDAAGALALFDRAVALAGKDEAARALSLHDRATALTALGRAAEAAAELQAAAALNEKLGRWAELGANRYLLASIRSGEGKAEEALGLLLGALEADKKAENGRGIAADLAALAKVARRLGRDAEAYAYWRRCFESALALDEAGLVREALEGLLALSKAAEAGPGGGVEARPTGPAPAEAARWKALLDKLDEAEGRRP